jgi:subtilisin family serine protease
MKRFSLVILLALVTGACATAPAQGPAPRPTGVVIYDAPAQPEPARPEPAPADPTVSVVPERWWLLDVETDGVYGASVDRAYREVLAARQPARTIIVAVIDSGMDIEHEDLRDNLWRNPQETKNGLDDDGDGLVDDVWGWNYIGGPDGRHVDHDTYEVTRLFATCIVLLGRGTPAAALPPQRVDAADCPAIEEAFEERRREYAEMLDQLRQMEFAVTAITALLRQQLGRDSLTVEAVQSLAPMRSDVRQARAAYLELASHGITPAMISEELERVEGLIEFAFNPEFDPRPIVGDDYADPTERVYGNHDVVGPDASHGTGVAGIIAAGRDNSIGIDGIASAVQVMTLRAVPNGDERDKDVANAIRYAVDHGAHIINMSFGKAFSPEKEVVDAAVRYADERGVLLIHAAGNDSKDLAVERNFPNRRYADGGMAAHWIEVGASAWQGIDQLAAPFSNYGAEQVDIFAPGVAILSAAPGNRYEQASGTSFAAPVVSGIAALLMAYYPELSAAQVRQVLLDSAARFADQMVVRPGTEDELVRFGDLSVTGGIVNAYSAVRMAEQLTRN